MKIIKIIKISPLMCLGFLAAVVFWGGATFFVLPDVPRQRLWLALVVKFSSVPQKLWVALFVGTILLFVIIIGEIRLWLLRAMFVFLAVLFSLLGLTLGTYEPLTIYKPILNYSLSRLVEEANVPHGGKEYLPVKVREAASLLREHNVTHFCLSPGFSANIFLRQRTQEFVWPRRVHPACWIKVDGKLQPRWLSGEGALSLPWLYLRDEPLPNQCIERGRKKHVVLLVCP